MGQHGMMANKYNGILSDRSIERALDEGNIFIAPFDRKQLQSAGYNLTPTCFVYSTKRKCLLNVIENDDETYVMIDRNDTVLIKTRESIAISSTLAGNFFSKVKIVSEGFGHVATTLDPGWEGKLLISINNPTNKKIKFSIKKKVYGSIIYNSFVTVEFIGLDSETEKKSDNPPGRLDILENTLDKNLSLLKRKKRDSLKELIDELNKCENISINQILLDMLNENEREELANIRQIQDNIEYENEFKEFMRIKERKYYRDIQNQFSINAQNSIDLVDKYVSQKLQYGSLKLKLATYIYKNMKNILGVVCIVALMVVLFILNTNKGDTKETAQAVKNVAENTNLFYAVTTMISMVLAYIGLPLIRDLFNKKL